MGERRTVWEQQRDHGVEVWWEDELGKVRDTPQGKRPRGLHERQPGKEFGIYEDLLSWW